MDKLLHKVRTAIDEHKMLAENEHVMVALSGGADSVALLLALRQLGYQVSACHLNHCLRGAESMRDEAFCDALCTHLDIPFTVQRADVAAHAGKIKESVETAARGLRYAFFADAVQQFGASKIATAHTASDTLETMLFHLARGTGLDGLCGIPPVRGKIVRPLISCTRTEVEVFLGAHGQAFVTDSTNLTLDYARNRIRHEVIPALCRLNTGAEHAAADLSARLRADADFLNEQTRQALDAAQSKNGWNIAVLSKLHPAVRTRALRGLCMRTGIPQQDFSARHVAALERLLVSENPSAQISLPGGYIVRREYDWLRAERVTAQREAPLREICVQIPFLGTLGNEFSQVSVRILEKVEFFYKSSNTFYVDCGTIDTSTLVLRPRCEGDRMRLSGGSKTLKKILIDKKIPRAQRARLSVLADRHGLIAVQGVGIDVSRRPQQGAICEIRFEG